jgi:hypothetical protein
VRCEPKVQDAATLPNGSYATPTVIADFSNLRLVFAKPQRIWKRPPVTGVANPH